MLSHKTGAPGALLLEVESETLVATGMKVPVMTVAGGADEDGA